MSDEPATSPATERIEIGAVETAAVEWWFVQGRFAGPRVGARSFMASVFRFNLTPPARSPRHGFSLVLSILEEDGERSHCRSWIDRRLLEWSVADPTSRRFANLDPRLTEIFRQEVCAQGPPRPVELVERPEKFCARPLEIRWGDFLLQQGTESVRLCFADPAGAGACTMELHPRSERRRIDLAACPAPVSEMDYTSWPRLWLQGELDGEPIRGEAWLDQQAGERGWLMGRGGPERAPGWDWFGFNLDDGSDCVFLLFRDAQSDEPIVQRAMIWDRKGRSRVTGHVEARKLRRWQSRRTRIRYPVAWELSVPEWQARLRFDPLCDEQEVPLGYPARAVWQGAGRVRGTLRETPVAGHARGEFFGYGYLFDGRVYIARIVETVERRIEEFLPRVIDEARLRVYLGEPTWEHEPRAYGEALTAPVWDLLSRSGKRWRPVFALLLLEALGSPSEPYELLLGTMMELAHTGALMIDDIEDQAEIRRGEETIHLRHGVDVTINAANTLYFLPNLLIGRHPHLSDRQKLRIHEIVMQHFVRAHFGQALDIYWSRKMAPESLDGWLGDSVGPKILQMYAYKTATGVVGAAEVAATIAGADGEVLEACRRFARSFGVGFQIMDDVHAFSDSPRWSKTCGEDLRQGKLTYAIYRALKELPAPQRSRLKRILCSPDSRRDARLLDQGISLVRDSGALALCRDEAQAMLDAAWSRFTGSLPPSEPKIMLYALCSGLVELSFDV